MSVSFFYVCEYQSHLRGFSANSSLFFLLISFMQNGRLFFAIEKMGMESRIRTGFSEGWGSDESELSSRREPKKQVGASIIPEFYLM